MLTFSGENGRDTPYRWRHQVHRKEAVGHRPEVFIVAALCKGLVGKLEVTSTLHHTVAEQALEKYGTHKKLSQTMLCGLQRQW